MESDVPLTPITGNFLPHIVGLRYLPDFITVDEAKALLDTISGQPWLNDLKRRVATNTITRPKRSEMRPISGRCRIGWKGFVSGFLTSKSSRPRQIRSSSTSTCPARASSFTGIMSPASALPWHRLALVPMRLCNSGIWQPTRRWRHGWKSAVCSLCLMRLDMSGNTPSLPGSPML